MNEFSRKPAYAVPNWQAPASTGKTQPAIEESQVEGALFRVVHSETRTGNAPPAVLWQ